jgi:replicative DNA helicase
MPPQEVEVEQAVLGAMLTDSRSIDKVADILPKEAFYHLPHQPIYDVILSLANQTLPVDQITVAAELKKRDQLDLAGGVVYLAKLAAEVATAGNAVYHARMVKEAWLKRRIIELAGETTREAYEASSESTSLVDKISASLLDLQSTREGEGLVHIEEIADSAFAGIERRRENRGVNTGITLGYREIDSAVLNLQPGDYMLIAGRPSHGKSTLAFNVAETNAARGKGVLIFSMEMSKEQVLLKMLSNQAEVLFSDIRSGLLGESEFRALAKATGKMLGWPLWVDDSGRLTPQTIERRVRDHQRRHQVDLVIIDYVQLMSSGDQRFSSREQEVSFFSCSIKGMAKNCKVPVIALSQMSRAVESRPDHRAQLSDLRDSGALEQDADLVMFVDRPEQRGVYEVTDNGIIRNVTGLAELILAKQRNGPLADDWVVFRKEYSRFIDIPVAGQGERVYLTANND